MISSPFSVWFDKLLEYIYIFVCMLFFVVRLDGQPHSASHSSPTHFFFLQVKACRLLRTSQLSFISRHRLTRSSQTVRSATKLQLPLQSGVQVYPSSLETAKCSKWAAEWVVGKFVRGGGLGVAESETLVHWPSWHRAKFAALFTLSSFNPPSSATSERFFLPIYSCSHKLCMQERYFSFQLHPFTALFHFSCIVTKCKQTFSSFINSDASDNSVSVPRAQ